MEYSLNWKGDTVRVKINKRNVRIKIQSPQKRDFVVLEIFGRERKLSTGRSYNFARGQQSALLKD